LGAGARGSSGGIDRLRATTAGFSRCIGGGIGEGFSWTRGRSAGIGRRTTGACVSRRSSVAIGGRASTGAAAGGVTAASFSGSGFTARYTIPEAINAPPTKADTSFPFTLNALKFYNAPRDVYVSRLNR
jgi:hypothetical protein